MDLEQLRTLCLSFPHTDEYLPFDEHTLAFRVGGEMGKIFCLVPLDRFDRPSARTGNSSATIRNDQVRSLDRRRGGRGEGELGEVDFGEGDLNEGELSELAKSSDEGTSRFVPSARASAFGRVPRFAEEAEDVDGSLAASRGFSCDARPSRCFRFRSGRRLVMRLLDAKE